MCCTALWLRKCGTRLDVVEQVRAEEDGTHDGDDEVVEVVLPEHTHHQRQQERAARNVEEPACACPPISPTTL